MSEDLARDCADLINQLHHYDALEALKVLVNIGEPVTRWTLEAIAIASPDLADRARALKPNPVRAATE